MTFKVFNAEFKSLSWLLVDKFLRLISGLFIISVIAHSFGVAEFGKYNYVITTLSVSYSIIRFGIPGLLVNYMVRNQMKSKVLISSGIQLQFFVSLFSVLLLLFFYGILGVKVINFQTLILLCLAILIQPLYLIRFYFESKNKFGFCIKLELIIYTVIIFLKLYLAWTYKDVNLIILAHILEFILINIFYLFYYDGPINFWKFSKRINIWLLKKSAPLFIASFFVILYMRLDQYIISYFYGNSELGYYSAALRISEILYSIPVLAVGVFVPNLIKLAKEDIFLYKKQICHLMTIFFYASLFAAIILTFASKNIIELIFGLDFHKAIDLLIINIWAGIFVSIGALGNKIYLIDGLGRYIAYNSFLGLIVNFLLNILLVPLFGSIGACIACILSYFFIVILADLLWCKTRHIFLIKFQSIFKPFNYAN